MKITCWNATRLLGLSGVVAVCGCVGPQTPTKSFGLTSQELMNVAEKPQPSSWLPKLPFSGTAKAAKPSSTPLVEETPAREQASKTKKEPADIMSMARLNERRGQVDMARQMYKKELEKNPNNGRAYHRLAVMAATEEQWDEANKLFGTAEKLLPDNSELCGDMGYALYLQHHLEPAETYLRRAVEINPRNQAAHNNLGIVLGVQGKFDEGFAEFRRVGTEAEAHTNLAYVYAQLGDIDRAMASLNQALALDPNQRAAAVALLQLNEMKRRLAPDEDTAKLLANQDPVKGPAQASSATSQVFQKQTAAAPPAKQVAPENPLPAGENTALAARSVPKQTIAAAKAPAAAEPAAPAARRGTQESDLVAEVADLPIKSRPVGKALLSQAAPAPTVTNELPLTKSQSPKAAEPGYSNQSATEASRQVAQFDPWLSQPRPKAAAALSPPRTTSEPAAGIIENKHVTTAKPAIADELSPAGQPPRTVAARPLPTKDAALAARPLAVAPAAASLDKNAEAGNVVQAAEPRTSDTSHTAFAGGFASAGSAQVTPVSASVMPPSKGKSSLTPPPPPAALAPVVTPTERMQQIRAKQRALDSAEQTPEIKRPKARPTESSKTTNKDESLLSMLPSAQFGSGAMMPKVQQPPNDPISQSSLLPTRQASVPIPRAEDLMPADALLHQAPMSSLHPAAQSTWSSTSQPLRNLTSQAMVAEARETEQAAASVGASAGRSGWPGGSHSPAAGSGQLGAGALPKTN